MVLSAKLTHVTYLTPVKYALFSGTEPGTQCSKAKRIKFLELKTCSLTITEFQLQICNKKYQVPKYLKTK